VSTQYTVHETTKYVGSRNNTRGSFIRRTPIVANSNNNFGKYYVIAKIFEKSIIFKLLTVLKERVHFKFYMGNQTSYYTFLSISM